MWRAKDGVQARPCGPEILEQEHLAERVARGDRHHREAHVLGAVVEAQAAGEEAVAVGDLDELAGLGPRGGERPRHDLSPDTEIVSGVAHHGGLALGAGGGVDADDLLARHREEPERVVLAQVVLHGEGQLARGGRASPPRPSPRPRRARRDRTARARGPGRRSPAAARPGAPASRRGRRSRPRGSRSWIHAGALSSPRRDAPASPAARGSGPWSRACADRRRIRG